METPKEYQGRATYSPDDNKLRLYPDARLDQETYNQVKKAGFKWAPQQKLFVAPMWTPERAELCEDFAGEIEDEDTGLVERAAERAERFGGYEGKRASEAASTSASVSATADGIPLGQPILVGHHSERRARKDAEKIESGLKKAAKLWDTAQYWQDRAKGAIRSAKYKELPAVRARRIKKIEADKRRAEKQKKDLGIRLKMWQSLGTPETFLKKKSGEASTLKEQVKFMLDHYDYMGSNGSSGQEAEDVQAQRIQSITSYITSYDRWIEHYDRRLDYERALLGEGPGLPVARKMPEKGGAITCYIGHGSWLVVQKVNKVSVSIEDTWGGLNSRPFMRKIQLEEITGIMSMADIEAAKHEGRFVQSTYLPSRFNLLDRQAPIVAKAKKESPSVDYRAQRDTMTAASKCVIPVSAAQLFPTPVHIASKMADAANLCGVVVGHFLDPSAGTGVLLLALKHRIIARVCDGSLTGIEINPSLTAILRQRIPGASIVQSDFLSCDPVKFNPFARILMNPPFINGSDIKHILHARKFLARDGLLVAICANGPRQTAELKPFADSWEELPEGTFKDQGTNVRTVMLTMRAA